MESSVRIDKGQAIVEAAIEIFGRDGFAAANVDEIARQAGVAKPTIYHRFGGKEKLFVEAVSQGANASGERVRSVIDSIDVRPADLRAELERVGRALVECLSSERGVAVTRMQISEQARFPEVIGELRARGRARAVDALAGKLAQLTTTGYLVIPDVQRAARHFVALTADDALATTHYGQRTLAQAEVEAPVREGIDTFLAAFLP